MAAHNGQLSREEMMAEMGKVSRSMPGQGGTTPEVKAPPARSTGGSKYGITQRFPEYQKSAYVPLHQSGRARVWILNASGKLEPMFVRTGVTDGRFTEITSADLKTGDQIVIGASSNSETASAQSTNPLAGSGQRPMGGGMR